MNLYINTTRDDHVIEVFLKKEGKIMARKRAKAKYAQAEKLLPLIDKILELNKIKLKDIKKIEVENHGESFTSLRIGILTANALAYALGIHVSSPESDNIKTQNNKINIVEPIYSREPNITIPKKKI